MVTVTGITLALSGEKRKFYLWVTPAVTLVMSVQDNQISDLDVVISRLR